MLSKVLRLVLAGPLIFFLSAMLNTAQGHAASDVVKAPAPSWVTDLNIPAPVPERLDQVRNGTYYLLVSRQNRMVGTRRTIYRRFAMNITNREGLEEAGNVSFSFRPELDTAAIHRIRIHRDGEVLDVLDQSQFRVFQQEEGLEEGILDGSLTALANLESVRVGDTVEYAYSITYEPVLMSDHYFDRQVINFGVPIGVLENRILLPDNLKIDVDQSGTPFEIEKSDIAGETIYSWVQENTDPIDYEDNVPSWYYEQDQVRISSIPSWAEVARDSLSHYPPVQSLPPAFTAKLDGIAASAKDPAQQISDVLSLVQNNIRYVGIEIGRGAFIPRAPDLVLSRGYGDCKDKSYLMVEALRHLGITAAPALAHLSEGASLNAHLPSPYAFNHVIVKAEADGETYWLDPTGTQQYSRDPAKSQANYGFVLPISEQTTELTEITPIVPRWPNMVVREDFDFDRSTDPATLRLKVTTVRKGDDADNFRRQLASRGERSFAKSYVEYYADRYGAIDEGSGLAVEDDIERNVLEVIETYAISNPDEEILKDFPMIGDTIRGALTKPKVEQRDTPFALRSPLHWEQRIIVDNLPTHYATLDPVTISTRYLDFSMRSYSLGKRKTIVWKLKTKSDAINPDEHEDYRKVYDQIRDATYWTYNFSDAVLDEIAEEDAAAAEVAAGEALANKVELGFYGALLAFALVALWFGIRGDQSYAAEGFYYPVTPLKIVILTFVSFGLYAAFWFYKFWAWSKDYGDRDVWAWARALFFGLFPYSAFDEANRHLPETQKLASFWGLLAMAAGLATMIIDSKTWDFEGSFHEVFGIFLAVTTGYCIAILPCAVAVYRLNTVSEKSRAVTAKNSRVTALNVIGALIGLFLTYHSIFDP